MNDETLIPPDDQQPLGETPQANPPAQPKTPPPGFTLKPQPLKRPMDKAAMNNDIAVLNSLTGVLNTPAMRAAAEDAGKIAETVASQARSNARAYRRPTGNRGEVLPPADPLTGSNQYDPQTPNIQQPKAVNTISDEQPATAPAPAAARGVPSPAPRVASQPVTTAAIPASTIVALLKSEEELHARLLGVCHQLSISPSPDPVSALRFYLVNRNLRFVFKQLGIEA